MEQDLNNMDYLYEKKHEYNCNNSYKNVFIVNGRPKSNTINLPTEEGKSINPIIVDTINIDTSCYCNTNIKLEFNINIFKEKGMRISKIKFQVFKICDNMCGKIPVGDSIIYTNNDLKKGIDLINIKLCDNDICNSGKCIYFLEAIL